MKIRNGFVSNSSSSSFIIHDVDMTFEQRLLIECACDAGTGWNCERTYGSIICYTDMDNFDMAEYLDKIGIPKDKIIWAESSCTEYLDGKLDVDHLFENHESIYNDIKQKANKILKDMYYNNISEDIEDEN